MLLLVAFKDDSTRLQMAEHYGRFWRRAAQSYLNRVGRSEYNSIKHGLRVRAGGHITRIRLEKAPGIPDPNAQAHTIAASEFGSSYFVPEQIGHNKHHLKLRHQAVNWRPQALADCIALSSFSIANTLTFLQIVNGEDPTRRTFSGPRDLALFASALTGLPGYEASSVADNIAADDIEPLSKEQIISVYENEDAEG
jgi:hypothetical protein